MAGDLEGLIQHDVGRSSKTFYHKVLQAPAQPIKASKSMKETWLKAQKTHKRSSGNLEKQASKPGRPSWKPWKVEAWKPCQQACKA